MNRLRTADRRFIVTGMSAAAELPDRGRVPFADASPAQVRASPVPEDPTESIVSGAG